MIGWRMMVKISAQIPGMEVHKAEAMIRSPTGGHVQLKSAMNPDSLRGEGLSRAVLDECADIPEIAWTDALRPALSDYQGDGIFIGTPKGRNWFWKLHQRARELEGWEAFQMATSTNPHIPRAELIAAQREVPKRTWDQEYLAKFVTFEGRVYEVFDPDGPWVIDQPQAADRYANRWGGIDFGFRNPTAMVVAGEDADGRLDVLEEVHQARLKNPEVVDLCKDLTDRHQVSMWWADPAQPAMIQELQDAGVPVMACPRSSGGQESVVAWEVRLVAGRFEEMRDGQPAPALRIMRSCTETVREHDGYRYPRARTGEFVASGNSELPLKKDDHSCNAVQYLVHGLHDWYGFDSGGGLAAGTRDSYGLPR